MNFEYFIKCWKGGEKLYVIFWLYFVVGLFGIGFFAALLALPFVSIAGLSVSDFVEKITTSFEVVAISIAVIPYYIWVLGALWSCAFNCSWMGWGYAARVLVVYLVISWLHDLSGL